MPKASLSNRSSLELEPGWKCCGYDAALEKTLSTGYRYPWQLGLNMGRVRDALRTNSDPNHRSDRPTATYCS